MEEAGTPPTAAMLQDAATLAGLEFSEAECEGVLKAVTQDLQRYDALHAIHIPNEVAPPFYFSPIVTGMPVNRAALLFRLSSPAPKRPQNLEGSRVLRAARSGASAEDARSDFCRTDDDVLGAVGEV